MESYVCREQSVSFLTRENTACRLSSKCDHREGQEPSRNQLKGGKECVLLETGSSLL